MCRLAAGRDPPRIGAARSGCAGPAGPRTYYEHQVTPRQCLTARSSRRPGPIRPRAHRKLPHRRQAATDDRAGGTRFAIRFYLLINGRTAGV